MKKNVGIVNIGYGNIGSILNAIQFLEIEVVIENNYKKLDQYSHLIFPGVGSFATNSEIIQKNGWHDELKKFVQKGSYIFGICVGMQMLFEKGSEGGSNKGLEIFKGTCDIFNSNLAIPHIGFNTVNHKNTEIWRDIPDRSSFYFLHSFRIKETDSKNKFCETEYGEKFISFIERDNVFGSQFHPEKSHRQGLKLLQNFLNLK